MKKIIITLCIWTITSNYSIAQDYFSKPNYVALDLSEDKQEYLIQS